MGRDPQMIWGTRPDAIYGLVDLMERASDDIARLDRARSSTWPAPTTRSSPPSRPCAPRERLPPAARSAYYTEGWHLCWSTSQRERVFDGRARPSSAIRPRRCPPARRRSRPHARAQADRQDRLTELVTGERAVPLRALRC